MPLPVVAIVGRPNVGKSSLFNWLAGRRISIVDPTAGVTRDRVSTILEVDGRYCELVDTGGMGIVDLDNLAEDVERQIRHAMDAASVVLFVVDIRDGVVPLDETVAERLRVLAKPVVFVANKADDVKQENAAGDLYRLGFGPPLLVSAEQKKGKEELFGEILARLPEGEEVLEAPQEADLKIALVGRRNVGKSTFINALAEAERVIVSEIPGTTRDSVDVRIERDGKTVIAIDTAGVRKRGSLANDIEYYSLHRAERSIRRADVVLQLFDPRVRVSRVDKQLAEYIVENHRAAIFVVNKWDLAKEKIPTEKWGKYLRQIFPMLEHVPIAFTTAKDGKNVFRLLQLARTLHKQGERRMKTGDLNKAIREAVRISSPPMQGSRLPKIYYAAQISTHPPTIVLVTNGPDLFEPTYLRYLMKAIRDASPFGEVAIKLIVKAKGEPGLVSIPRPAAEESVSPDESHGELPVVAAPPPTPATEERERPAPAPRPRKKKAEPGTWEL